MKRVIRHPRLLVGVLALASTVLAVSMGSGSAFAGYTACQTDPTVVLSTGQTVTLWTTVNTDISNVQSINYVLHLPPGVSVVSVSYDQYASLENFSSVNDQANKHAEADTTVNLNPSVPAAQVTAWASTSTLTSVLSMTGTTGQLIPIYWKLL
jgi:hypothetical protein